MSNCRRYTSEWNAPGRIINKSRKKSRRLLFRSHFHGVIGRREKGEGTYNKSYVDKLVSDQPIQEDVYTGPVHGGGCLGLSAQWGSLATGLYAALTGKARNTRVNQWQMKVNTLASSAFWGTILGYVLQSYQSPQWDGFQLPTMVPWS